MDNPGTISLDRVTALLAAEWPHSAEATDAWLVELDLPRSIRRPPDATIPHVTALEASIHRGRPVGVHWFAGFATDAELINAHTQLSNLVTLKLGPSTESLDRSYGSARLWRAADFTVETYAHISRAHKDPSQRASVPVLQISVDLTALADVRNAEDEAQAKTEGRA